MKIRDLDKIARLQEIADRLNISRLDLIDTEHSEITTFRRETKIEAIKAARNKAIYLLGAISERIGKPVFVKEVEEETPRYVSSGVLNSYSNYSSNITTRDKSPGTDSDLSFSQIRLRYVIIAKFEIE